MIMGKHLIGESDLAQIISAKRHPGADLPLGKHRQQQGGEEADDGNHTQQLNQSEGTGSRRNR